MSSARGDSETTQLRNNIQSQLNRLLTQLRDLEELKDDMDPSEFEQSRDETLAQIHEFEESLRKMLAGNMSLVDDVGKMQLVNNIFF